MTYPPEQPGRPQGQNPHGWTPPDDQGGQPSYGALPPPAGQPNLPHPPTPPGYGAPPAVGHGPGPGYPPMGPAYGRGASAPYRPRFDPGEAISYGWNAFTKNVGPSLLLALAAVVISVILSCLDSLLTGAMGTGFSTGAEVETTVAQDLASMVFSIISSIAAFIFAAGFIRMGFDILDGRRASLETAFTRYNLGLLIAVSAVISVVTVGVILLPVIGLGAAGATTGSSTGIAAGLLLGVAVGLVVAFVVYLATMLIPAQAVTGQTGFGESVSQGLRLFKQAPGRLLLLIVLFVLLIIPVICTCGLGIFIYYPVVGYALAYAHRTLSGGPVHTPM